MSVGENIRRLRTEANMTQEELAEKLEVVRSTVTQWERGWSQPRMAKVQQLAEVFHTTPSALVAEADLPYPVASAASAAPEVDPKFSVPFFPLERTSVESPSTVEGALRRVEVTASLLAKHPNAQATTMEDDCMDRVIPTGMTVVYDPDLVPRNGHIAIVYTDDLGPIVRRYYRGGNTLMLVADSHATHDDIVLSGGIPVGVVGTVVWTQPAKPLA